MPTSHSLILTAKAKTKARLKKIGKVGELSDELEVELPIWRIWKETGTNLNELKYEWTYSDIKKASAILDMYDDYGTAARELDNRDIR